MTQCTLRFFVYNFAMLFVNISADQILLQCDGIREVVQYDDLERTLPIRLKGIYDRKPFTKVWLLNGPGGFTILRIGALVFNAMQLTLQNTLQFYSCTKLDLYATLIRKGFLPSEWYIFIWQKKNMRKAFFDEKIWDRKTTIQSIEHWSVDSHEEYFVDTMYDHPLKNNFDSEKMISLSFEYWKLLVTYNNKNTDISFDELALEGRKYVQPNYMMEPEITVWNKPL